jgi:hypothetical protein
MFTGNQVHAALIKINGIDQACVIKAESDAK